MYVLFPGNDKQACMIMMFFPFSDWYRRLKAVADPDLQIIRARSSRPWDKGGGGGGGGGGRRVVWKKIFSALRASVSSKNKAGGRNGPLPCIRHCQVLRRRRDLLIMHARCKVLCVWRQKKDKIDCRISSYCELSLFTVKRLNSLFSLL